MRLPCRYQPPPGWHSIVRFGSYGAVSRDPPTGPYRSRDLANAALARFLRGLGAESGSYAAATSVRVAGPFPTREVARRATIANYPQLVRRGRT